MAQSNPMSGPAYVIALRNALDKRTAEYHSPPRTGGAQVLTRFDEFVRTTHDGHRSENPAGTGPKSCMRWSNGVFLISTNSLYQNHSTRSSRRLSANCRRPIHRRPPSAEQTLRSANLPTEKTATITTAA